VSVIHGCLMIILDGGCGKSAIIRGIGLRPAD
jgi:hypothetical protein